MKIAVCVKQVPDATAVRRLDPSTNRLDRSGEGALNADRRERRRGGAPSSRRPGEGEVVVVSLGPEKAVESLRKALAMGADRAVLVSDEAAAGSDLVATSYVLAQALEREEADLVLFGQQSSDSDGAVLWAAVADRLRRPLISQVAELKRRRATGDREAPDRVRLRRDRRAAARRRGRVGRDQRAALPVAEGDHGREVEAERTSLARRCRRRGQRVRGGGVAHDGRRDGAAARRKATR